MVPGTMDVHVKKSNILITQIVDEDHFSAFLPLHVIWIGVTNTRMDFCFAIIAVIPIPPYLFYTQPCALSFPFSLALSFSVYLFSVSLECTGEKQIMYCVHYVTSGKIEANNGNVKMRQALLLVRCICSFWNQFFLLRMYQSMFFLFVGVGVGAVAAAVCKST